ncbi:MAG: zf-HC2 domain-containing protein [Anaerolineales bacterium]
MTEHEHAKCRELLGFLSDYVDGTLGEQLCQEIERHMRECQNCRVVVDTLRKTISLYHETAGPADLPNGVRQRLYRTLNLDEFLR